MKNIITFIKKIPSFPFELWCIIVTICNTAFNHVSKDNKKIILSLSDPTLYIELQKMRKDFQLSDYNDILWKKKLSSPSYEIIKDLQGLFLWNNNLKHAVLLFKDSNDHLRMACYNLSKGFVISSDDPHAIRSLLRNKNSYPKLNVREYYFAFSEDL